MTEDRLGWPMGMLFSPNETSPQMVAGAGPNVMQINGHRLGLSLCFEGILPDLAEQGRAAGAQALINPVSDDWLIDPVMRRYHEALARSVALAHNLPLLRISNRGRTIVQSSSGELLFSQTASGNGPQIVSVLLPLIPSEQRH